MTPQIEIASVDKHYGAYHALKDINLTIPRGAFTALVGPSGCGKSTLLRSIAGLESITSGNLRIAGTEMSGVPPRKRDVAMVFQSYALYPHMNVLGNLTYSLRFKGFNKEQARKKADEVAQVIGLTELLERYPRELSGGQRQRVAMGRAIICEPKAFLFDEPLSNLDAALRVHMRMEIRALHDRLGATSVYVTHDQVEAMTMADHVVVMRAGVIEQQGAPLELYDNPANKFVAGFIGSPAMNFLDATVAEDGRSARLEIAGKPVLPLARTLQPGREVTVGLRPEHLRIDTAAPRLQVPVRVVESTGSLTYSTTETEPELMIVEQGRGRYRAGETLPLTIAPEDIHLFDPTSGTAL
ncbi:putative sugar uptake ABC transporter ATP-binding protein [Oceanicola granulosus HTCC2516]|uniref:Putative sugar uptake ABC transporter ATP-binding protein n=1 Tax=Oceanicola granulosus (strain ATCC BAA-861 / DSM 15982 / KCTC 12143 / HTCC2516) TaxID=314256 RepID=Q2CKB4_OCEGH|nr:sn-glycerol-3-phosphate ABC transporter ATP-binding protein UgpC [Oceanicola granulosus]EAR52875.1 putative sugar uptake ABC transporter ATP-binding protein [Oceanicola granulosus HTCC2516]